MEFKSIELNGYELNENSEKNFFYIGAKATDKDFTEIIEVEEKAEVKDLPLLIKRFGKDYRKISDIKGPYKLSKDKKALESTEETTYHLIPEAIFSIKKFPTVLSKNIVLTRKQRKETYDPDALYYAGISVRSELLFFESKRLYDKNSEYEIGKLHDKLPHSCVFGGPYRIVDNTELQATEDFISWTSYFV